MSTNYNFKTAGYSEIDKFAIKSYSAIHNIPEDKNWGDITQIYPENLPDITFLAGGSPCQEPAGRVFRPGLLCHSAIPLRRAGAPKGQGTSG